MNQQAIDREFLRLAGVFLSCRLELMGGFVIGKAWARKGDPVKTMAYALLGELDYIGEMRLLCREMQRHAERASAAGVS